MSGPEAPSGPDLGVPTLVADRTDHHAFNVRLVVIFDGLIVLFVILGGFTLSILRVPVPNWLGNLAATALGSMGTLLTFTFTGVVADRRER